MSDTIRSPAGLLVGAFKNIFAPGAAKSETCLLYTSDAADE